MGGSIMSLPTNLVQWMASSAGDAHGVPFYRDPILQGVIEKVDKAGGSVDANTRNDIVVWAGNTDRAAGGDDTEAFAVMAAAGDIIDSWTVAVSTGYAALAAKVSGIGQSVTEGASNATGNALEATSAALQKLPTIQSTGKWIIIVLILVAVIAVANSARSIAG